MTRRRLRIPLTAGVPTQALEHLLRAETHVVLAARDSGGAGQDDGLEPGLYCKAIGGVRVEDMAIVTEDGCENLNALPEGLTWA